MTNLETILALELENKRLREALREARKALSDPAPTTGLLRLAKAAYGYVKSNNYQQIKKALAEMQEAEESLSPEVKELMEI